MRGYIYRTTCLVDGMSFIGMRKTSTVVRNQLGTSPLLDAAITKHGNDKFCVEILHLCEDPESLTNARMFYMLEFNSIDPKGYNGKIKNPRHLDAYYSLWDKIHRRIQGKIALGDIKNDVFARYYLLDVYERNDYNMSGILDDVVESHAFMRVFDPDANVMAHLNDAYKDIYRLKLNELVHLMDDAVKKRREEFIRKLSEQTPWNKGKEIGPHSSEHRLKIAEKMMGNKNNPNFGGKTN